MKACAAGLLLFFTMICRCSILEAQEKLPVVFSANGVEKLSGKHVQVSGIVEKQAQGASGKFRLTFADGSYLPVWGSCASCQSYEASPVSVTAWVSTCPANAPCAGLIGLKNVESVQRDDDSPAIMAEVLALFGPENREAKVVFSNLRISGIKAFIDVFVAGDSAAPAAGASYLCFLIKSNGKWRVKMRQDLSTF